jgi:hypothetical protein
MGLLDVSQIASKRFPFLGHTPENPDPLAGLAAGKTSGPISTTREVGLTGQLGTPHAEQR